MKPRVLISCILACTILLVFIYFNFNSGINASSEYRLEFSRFSDPNRIRFDNTEIDIQKLNIDKKNKIPILAIGAIYLKTCSGCINELLEFSNLIDKIEDQFFSTDRIEKIYILIGQDQSKTSWFINTHGIKEEAIFVHQDSTLARILTHWDENIKANQWIFINRNKEMVVSRVAVLSGITSLTLKEDLLNRAIFSSELNFD